MGALPSRLHLAPQDSESGKYEKKAVSLTLVETVDPQGNNVTSLVSHQLNLADFVDADRVEKKLPLACGSAITAACGQPTLSVTIRHVRPPVRLFPPRAHTPPSAACAA